MPLKGKDLPKTTRRANIQPQILLPTLVPPTISSPQPCFLPRPLLSLLTYFDFMWGPTYLSEVPRSHIAYATRPLAWLLDGFSFTKPSGFFRHRRHPFSPPCWISYQTAGVPIATVWDRWCGNSSAPRRDLGSSLSP